MLEHNEAMEVAIHRIKTAVKLRSYKVDLSNLQIQKLPANVHELAPFLTALDLSECEALTSLSGIETLTCLTTLDVTGCDALRDLTALERLTTLTTLHAGWCDALNNLDGIGKLTNLTSLDLSECRAVTSLQKFENLRELISLDISGADLLTTLTGIEKLKALTTLNVSGCQNLRDLEGVQHLKALTILDANECTSLQTFGGIEQLTNLVQLYVENSAIEEITPLVLLLSISNSLKEVYLAGSPLERQHNLQLTPSENCLRYVHNIIHQKSSTLVKFRLPAKVLLLGNHAVGKSTLVNLLDDTTSNSGSTHVLKVSPYGTIQQNEAELVKLKLPEAVIFDFGGQDYYHGVYRLFMEQNAVTCLLWKSSAEVNGYKTDCFGLPNLEFDRNYWLGSLKHYQQQKRNKNNEQFSNRGHSPQIYPLLLLQTHVEPGGYWQTNYEGARMQHHFSLVPSSSIEYKKSERMVGGKLNHLHSLDQAAFYHFKTQLDYLINQQQLEIERSVWYANFLQFILQSHKDPNFTTTSTTDLSGRYRSSNNEKTLEADIKINNLLGVELELLHKQGLVLYYPDVTKAKVWLSPMAFARYVHETVLGKERYTRNYGKIPQHEFEKNIDKHILQILRQEKVVFLHQYGGDDGNTPEYIIPNYLPLANVSCAEYKLYTFALPSQPDVSILFENYLPLGLVNQLVCYFGNLPDYKKFWRDQIIFTLDKKDNHGGSLVLIKLVFEKRLQIKIYLQNSDIEQKKHHVGYLYYVLMAMYHDESTPESLDSYLQTIMLLKKGDLLKKFQENERKAKVMPIFSSKDTTAPGPVDALEAKLQAIIPLYKKIYLDSADDLKLSIDGEYYVSASELRNLSSETMVTAKFIENDKKSINIQACLFSPFVLQKPKKRLKVFISYAHEDTIFREQLQKFLSNMLRANQIEIWHDNKIYAGEPWDHTIKQKLAEADVAVVLTSQDLLASDYIQQTEMPLMIKLHQERGLTILPVLLKDCCFDSWQVAAEQMARNGDAKAAPFDVSTLQFLPKDDNEQLKPVVEWQPFEEKAWKKVSQALQQLIDAQ